MFTKLSSVTVWPVDATCCTSTLNRLGFDGCGVTLTSSVLPHTPGLFANSVSDPPAVAAADTTPGPPIVNIGDELAHATVFVTGCVVVSDIIAVATSEILSPAGT